MSEQTPFLVPSYSALAEVYDPIGYADYAAQHVSLYLTYIQSLDWAGRHVIDLGCGTGVSSLWLAQQGCRVIGVDLSPHMLAQAQARLAQADELPFGPPEFIEMDMRQLESPVGPVDLVLAIGGVLNYAQNLRELETTLGRVSRTLEAGRFFAFDLHTIHGLADLRPEEIRYDDGHELTMIVQNHFSFETLSLTRHYLIWRRQDELWLRRDELHVTRSFPVQGIIGLLERVGFHAVAVLNADMEPLDTQRDLRAVFVAQKRS
jgi:predicted TPR repeat methyltransferase